MPTKQDVEKVLKEIPDPEIGVSILDLGLIYDITIDEKKGLVRILMTLTSIGCPLFDQIAIPIREGIGKLKGVKKVDVDLTFEPAWDTEKMSEITKKHHGNILVVDDDQDFVQMVKESLEDEGFAITTAFSGKEAIAHYKDMGGEIDVVLLDMLLPEMHGTEIFYALKNLNQRAKIVLCSGYSIEGEASALLENGALAFIQKPFDISEVVDVISGLLQKKLRLN